MMTLEEFIIELKIKNNDERCDHITFEHTSFANVDFSGPTISQIDFKKEVLFENCDFHTNFVIGNVKIPSIKFYKCTAKDISINSAYFEDKLEFLDSNTGEVSIKGGSVKGGCEITDCEFKALVFENGEIGGEGIKIISNNYSKIGTLKILVNQKNKISLQSLKIEELIFSGSQHTTISIENCQIQKFTNFGLTLSSKYIIESIKPEEKDSSIIDFSGTTLHHLEVLNSDLSKYETIKFNNSKLNLFVFSNSSWKTNIRENIYDSINEHRFLKNKMSELGNKVDELFFLAYELDAHRQSLKFRKKPGEKTILFLNRWTNNYRLSIWWPIIWFIVFGAILFCGIICCEGLSLTDNWGKLFVFFNPTHRLNFLGAPMQNFSLFLDFTGRIFMSYFIYQFIQAFRRHSVR